MIKIHVGYEDVNDDENNDDNENNDNAGIKIRMMGFGYLRSEWETKFSLKHHKNCPKHNDTLMIR